MNQLKNNKKRMANFNLKILFLFFIGINSLNAQIVESDSIRISNNNCATRFVRDYMFKMGIFEKNDTKEKPLNSRELVKGSEFEKEVNGVFLISPLSAHRRKLIVLKKEDKIKILTFNDVSTSMIDLISFLRDIKSSDEDLYNYINAIQTYLRYSKNTIKNSTKIDNSDWLRCK